MDKSLSMDGSLTAERSQFIMKVYGLLTLSLFSCVAGGVVGSAFITVKSGALFPLQIAGLVALIAAMVCRHVPGLNLALLFGFTFLDGMIAGPVLTMIGAAGYGNVIGQAVVTTFGTFAALTAYVFWAKTDFSYLKGFLFSGLIALIITGFFGALFGMGHAANLVYSYAGVLIFIGYILFDTSNIIHHAPTNEYVTATLDLFLDIINLFWFILRIFLNRDRD